jgi:hypothetical protein
LFVKVPRPKLKVHLGSQVGFEGLITNNQWANHLQEFCRVFHSKSQYERYLKIIWPTIKKKGKIMKILEDYGDFILIVS